MGQQDLLAWIYQLKKDKTESLQLDGPARCACSPQGQHFHLPSWPDESPGEKVHILIIHIYVMWTAIKSSHGYYCFHTVTFTKLLQ